jgi:Icc-related predicted phosphoesterase
MDTEKALFDDHWQKIPDGVNILITHGPPYGVCDYTPAWAENAGSTSLMGNVMSIFGKRKNPLIHIFGHIHEGYGKFVDGNYWAFNVSVCDLLYDPVNPVTVIEV